MSSKPASSEDDELLQALPKIDSAFRGGSTAPAGAAGLAAAAVDPCAVYKQLAPFLPTLIKAAKKIPIIGPRLAQALTLLQQIGEKCCK
jgi:hypothetical protein